jgi:carbon-monoxide dehydrogenase medium subunit
LIKIRGASHGSSRSLANNDPTADYPARTALGATIVTNKAGSRRTQACSRRARERRSSPVMFPGRRRPLRNPHRPALCAGRQAVAKRPSDVRRRHRRRFRRRVPHSSFEEALKKALSKALDGLTVPATVEQRPARQREYRAHLIAVLARRAVEAATGKA